MADEFIGDPAPLRDRDYRNAADSLGCSVAAIRAVAEVESSGGGFLPDGRPKLLYERHVFHARTRGRFGAAYPALSSPERGGYLGGAREYDRLAAAIALDRKAALESASWGKFQIMGFNAGLAGYADVERFVAAMVSGEPAQLAAFVAFIKACKLDGALVRGDWAAFARGYNGSAFAQNGYDRKIAAAYARFAGNEAEPLLRLGDSGTAVSRLQALIGQAPDGVFGRDTHTRIIALQRQAALPDDGVVGPRTWAWLRRRARIASDPAQVT